ncbi:MAG: agmatine deiminase family protein [Adlercreutzia equolifaciens]
MEDGTLIWPGSFAAHADEYCRFVDEDTVLLAEVTEEEAAEGPISAENKRRIDAAYEILKNETLPDGRPLKIVRMPFPEHLIFRGSQDNPTVMGWKQFFDENGGVAFDGTPWPEGDYCFVNSCSYCNFLVCNDVVFGPALLARGHGSEDQGEGRAR